MIALQMLLSFLKNPVVQRAILVILVVGGIFWSGYSKGSSSVQGEWDQEKAAQAEAVAKLREEQAKVTDALVTDYEKMLEQARSNTTTVIKKVPVYVPKDSCPLPAGFRVLHNEAASSLPTASGSSTATTKAVGSDNR